MIMESKNKPLPISNLGARIVREEIAAKLEKNGKLTSDDVKVFRGIIAFVRIFHLILGFDGEQSQPKKFE